MKRKLFAAMFAVFACALPALARVYYVSPTGSGTEFSYENPGSTYDGMDQAFEYNTTDAVNEIIFLDGVYHLTDATWKNDATHPYWCTRGAGKTTIARSYSGDASKCVLDFSQVPNATFVSCQNNTGAVEVRGLTFTGISVDNSLVQQHRSFFVNWGMTSGAVRFKIIGCHFVNNYNNNAWADCTSNQAQYRGFTDPSGNEVYGLYGCAFVSNGWARVDEGNRSGRVIKISKINEAYNCFFMHNNMQATGLSAYNCTVVLNRDGARWSGGHDSSGKSLFSFSTITKNCIVLNNTTGYGTFTGYSGNCQNCLYDCYGTSGGSSGWGADCVSNDNVRVGFAKSPKWGYHCVPVWGNWVRDQGADYTGCDGSDPLYATDLNGNPRKVNGVLDIGCCEAQTTGSGAKDLQASWVAAIPDQKPPRDGHFALKVTVNDGSKTLVEGVDYVVSAARTDENFACQAVITGIGEYSGTVYKDFNLTNRALYIRFDGSRNGDCNSLETAGCLGVAVRQAARLGGESWEKPCEVLIQSGTTDNPLIYDIAVLGWDGGNGRWYNCNALGGSDKDYVYIHSQDDNPNGTYFARTSSNSNMNYTMLRTTKLWKVGSIGFTGWTHNQGNSCISGHSGDGSRDVKPTAGSMQLIATNIVCRSLPGKTFDCDFSPLLVQRAYDIVFDSCTLSGSNADRGGFFGYMGDIAAGVPYVDIDGVLITNCTSNSDFFQWSSQMYGRICNVKIVDSNSSHGYIYFSNSAGYNYFGLTNWYVKCPSTSITTYFLGLNGKVVNGVFDSAPTTKYWEPKGGNAAKVTSVYPDCSVGFENCKFNVQTSKVKICPYTGVNVGMGVEFALDNCTFAKGTTFPTLSLGYYDGNKYGGVRIKGCKFSGTTFPYQFYYSYNQHNGPNRAPQDCILMKDNVFEYCTFKNQCFYWNECRNMGPNLQNNIFDHCTFESNLFVGDGQWNANFATAYTSRPYRGMFIIKDCQFLYCTNNATSSASDGVKGNANGSVFCGQTCTGVGAATNCMSLVSGCTFRGTTYTVENSMGWAQRAYYENCTFEDETITGSAGTRGLLDGSAAYRCLFKNIRCTGAPASANTQTIIMNGQDKGYFYLHGCRITGCTGGLVGNWGVLYNCLIDNNTTPCAIQGCFVNFSTFAKNSGTAVDGKSRSSTYENAFNGCVSYGNNTSGTSGCYDVMNYTQSGYVQDNVVGTWSNLQNLTDTLTNTDPLFVDAANNDFRLQNTSPALDRGSHSQIGNIANSQIVYDGGDYRYAHRKVGTYSDSGCNEIGPEPFAFNYTTTEGYDYTNMTVNVSITTFDPGAKSDYMVAARLVTNGVVAISSQAVTVAGVGDFTVPVYGLVPGVAYTLEVAVQAKHTDILVQSDAYNNGLNLVSVNGAQYASLADALNAATASGEAVELNTNITIDSDRMPLGTWSIIEHGKSVIVIPSSTGREVTYVDGVLSITESTPKVEDVDTGDQYLTLDAALTAGARNLRLIGAIDANDFVISVSPVTLNLNGRNVTGGEWAFNVAAGGALSLTGAGNINGGLRVTGGTLNTADTVVFTGDLNVTGGSATIAGDVGGDLNVSGGSAAVTGDVAGALTAGGTSVTVGGTVGSTATVSAGTVSVTGAIGDAATITGGTVTFSAEVSGAIAVSGGSLTLAGTAGTAAGLTISGGASVSVTSSGTIGTALAVENGHLTLAGSGEISVTPDVKVGTLTLATDQLAEGCREIEIPSAASIAFGAADHAAAYIVNLKYEPEENSVIASGVTATTYPNLTFQLSGTETDYHYLNVDGDVIYGEQAGYTLLDCSTLVGTDNTNLTFIATYESLTEDNGFLSLTIRDQNGAVVATVADQEISYAETEWTYVLDTPLTPGNSYEYEVTISLDSVVVSRLSGSFEMGNYIDWYTLNADDWVDDGVWSEDISNYIDDDGLVVIESGLLLDYTPQIPTESGTGICYADAQMTFAVDYEDTVVAEKGAEGQLKLGYVRTIDEPMWMGLADDEWVLLHNDAIAPVAGDYSVRVVLDYRDSKAVTVSYYVKDANQVYRQLLDRYGNGVFTVADPSKEKYYADVMMYGPTRITSMNGSFFCGDIVSVYNESAGAYTYYRTLAEALVPANWNCTLTMLNDYTLPLGSAAGRWLFSNGGYTEQAVYNPNGLVYRLEGEVLRTAVTNEVLLVNGDTETEKEFIEDAILDALNGNTIQLITNVEVFANFDFTAQGKFTLDLAGRDLKATGRRVGLLGNSDTLSITNSTEKQGHILMPLSFGAGRPVLYAGMYTSEELVPGSGTYVSYIAANHYSNKVGTPGDYTSDAEYAFGKTFNYVITEVEGVGTVKAYDDDGKLVNWMTVKNDYDHEVWGSSSDAINEVGPNGYRKWQSYILGCSTPEDTFVLLPDTTVSASAGKLGFTSTIAKQVRTGTGINAYFTLTEADAISEEFSEAGEIKMNEILELDLPAALKYYRIEFKEFK